jgi:hypothetical protein
LMREMNASPSPFAGGQQDASFNESFDQSA